MKEHNISSPLSLATFFLTQQRIICESKIEKYNTSLGTDDKKLSSRLTDFVR